MSCSTQARELGPELLNNFASAPLAESQAEAGADAQGTHEDRQCWICLSGGEGLIAPCQCSGSMKWVHRSCLDRWRVDSTNPRNFTHCRHCGFAFQLVLQRPPTQDEQQLNKRRRRFMRTTISHFLLSSLLVQAGLMLLGMIIRAIDSHERLVVLFGLPQVEASPPAGEGDFMDSLRYHKSTYYLAALLSTLFFVGVVASYLGCLRLCNGAGECTGCTNPCPRTDFITTYYCGECMGDCCYFSGRCCECSECPECQCPTRDVPCDCCETGSNGNDCGSVMLVIAIILIAAMIFIGFIIVLVAITAWIQKAIARYVQLKELRQLTGEYVVQDLSLLPASDIESGPGQLSMNQPEPSAPPANMVCPFAPVTSRDVQMSLSQDLQAVYGYSV